VPSRADASAPGARRLESCLEASGFLAAADPADILLAGSREAAESLRGAACPATPRAYAEDAMREADALRERPVPAMPFSAWRLYDETGDRGRFEAPYFERRRGLVAAALGTWLRGEARDLQLLEDYAWAICDEYAWALPAHLEGSCLDPARLPEHPGLLDLFSCETAFALAEITSLLGPALTPIVAARARNEVERRVLGPFLDRPRPWRWELMTNNWCAVCAGSVGAAALYLVRDGERLAAIFARVLPTLYRFLDSFAADGTCLEGVGYWTYGFGFFASFAELLSRATGGAVDLLTGPKVERIAEFQGRSYLNGRLALSFADGGADERYRVGLAARLARRFPGARPPDPGLAAPFAHDRFGRWCLSFRDLWWGAEAGNAGGADAGPAAPPRAPGPTWLPEAQWLLCPELSPGGLAFAAKGGHNDEPHNHCDVGSFELAAGEAQLLADLGCGEYTREYFSEGRYAIFCNSSLGHSLPIVGGKGQVPGQAFRSRDARCRIAGRASLFSLDLAGAYDLSFLHRLSRSFEFDGERSLVLKDEYELGRPGVELVERFVSRMPKAAFSVSGDGSLLLDLGGGRTLRIRCSEACARAALSSVAHREHDGSGSLVTCVDYAFRPGSERFAVAFDFTLTG